MSKKLKFILGIATLAVFALGVAAYQAKADEGNVEVVLPFYGEDIRVSVPPLLAESLLIRYLEGKGLVEKELNFGGATDFNEVALSGELKFKSDSHGDTSDAVSRLVHLDVPAGVNQKSWKNDTGHDLLIKVNLMDPTGSTASTSIRRYVYGSTTEGILPALGFDSSATDNARLTNTVLGNQILVNDEIGTTTTSFASSTPSGLAEGSGTFEHIVLASGDFLNYYRHKIDAQGCIDDGTCTSASSTDLGLTEDLWVWYYAPASTASTTLQGY